MVLPQIEVTFDIDANGIVHVSAKDLGTGQQQSVQITPSSGLSENEIKRMQREAEAHRAEDEVKKKRVEARNQLDGLTYSVERTLRENGSKLDSEVQQSVGAAVQEAKKHLESQDLLELTQATERLTQASQRMSEQLYRSIPAGSQERKMRGSGEQGATSEQDAKDQKEREKKSDDVIDADYREVG